MSDPSLPGTPGTGPIPEPEAEGFREEQVEAEKQRLLDKREDELQRSKEAKDFYSGTPEEAPPVEPEEPEVPEGEASEPPHEDVDVTEDPDADDEDPNTGYTTGYTTS